MTIYDTDEFKKVIGAEMKRAMFESHMKINGKKIRFIEGDDELMKLEAQTENDGGLNKQEMEFYEKDLFSARVKAQAKVTGKNSPDYHALPLDEYTKAHGPK